MPNIDPAKFLQFLDVMLSHVQDDERARRGWEESDAADLKKRRRSVLCHPFRPSSLS